MHKEGMAPFRSVATPPHCGDKTIGYAGDKFGRRASIFAKTCSTTRVGAGAVDDLWIKVSGWQGVQFGQESRVQGKGRCGGYRQLVAAAVQKCDGVYSRVLKFNEHDSPEKGQANRPVADSQSQGVSSDPVLAAQAGALTGLGRWKPFQKPDKSPSHS